ncbi:MAG: DsbA family oxidoreductase [Sphingomonas sp.]
MTKPVKIEFVSDIVCPWCVIGLAGLEQALAAMGDEVAADIRFEPFELNPNMPPEGQNVTEHIAEKYGSTPAQSASNRAAIQARAAELGFTMNGTADSRIYNTFDAHRLLHWAGEHGLQAALKRRLFVLYFTEGGNPSAAEALVAAAASVGLDGDEARAILSSDRYTADVRTAERLWVERGITGVPAIVINEKYLISGGQPPEIFEKALRQIASES